MEDDPPFYDHSQNPPYPSKNQEPTGTTLPPRYDSSPLPDREELARVFNTALISTQTKTANDLSTELMKLNQSAEFEAILGAVRDLARSRQISLKEAAENLIQAFRNIDKLWKEYVFLEGIEKIRKG